MFLVKYDDITRYEKLKRQKLSFEMSPCKVILQHLDKGLNIYTKIYFTCVNAKGKYHCSKTLGYILHGY